MRKMIFRNTILYILIIAAGFTLAGCKKGFLDIKPKGQLIPQTTDDYREILDFVSNKNSVGEKSCVLVTYGVVNLLADDYQISDSTQYKAMITTDRSLWYKWGQQGVYADDREDPDWKALYGQIYIMNSAIDGIPNASGPQADKDELLAEAQFHRAFCYLGLANIYAKAYNSSSASTDLGVPMRLGIALNESLKRGTVQDVYDLVIKDLQDALPKLKDNQGVYNFRPTTAAAYALLARTYLYMGDYPKALDNADKSLQVNNFLYDYNAELDLNPASTKYGYFKNQATFRSWDDKEILLQKETTYNTSLYYYGYSTIWGPTVWSLYDTTNDLRYINYFKPTTSYMGYTFSGSIKRWQDAYYYLQVGLSVPEMYLTRAETNARLGNKTEAINDLNTLRSKRYRTGTLVLYDANNYTQDQVLQLVKDERRRELWLRGVRWFDLKRYNSLDNANITIERFFTGDKLKPGDYGWVMPIGNKYIDQNPEIIQNEGYQ